jgi:hypothetical protein
MAHYGGLPQDVEWAIAGGRPYLLQARPVTGVELSWDEDMEFWQEFRTDDETTLWTRTWADELWNGGVTPLHYSCRAPMFTHALDRNIALWGIPARTEPMFRYHRGTAYYNTEVERRLVEQTAPVPFRPPLLAHVAPDEREEVPRTPLSTWRYLRMHTRIQVLGRPVHGALRYFRTVDDHLHNRVAEADGLGEPELRALDDQALIDYLEHFVWLKSKNTEDQWSGFFIFARASSSRTTTGSWPRTATGVTPTGTSTTRAGARTPTWTTRPSGPCCPRRSPWTRGTASARSPIGGTRASRTSRPACAPKGQVGCGWRPSALCCGTCSASSSTGTTSATTSTVTRSP